MSVINWVYVGYLVMMVLTSVYVHLVQAATRKKWPELKPKNWFTNVLTMLSGVFWPIWWLIVLIAMIPTISDWVHAHTRKKLG